MRACASLIALGLIGALAACGPRPGTQEEGTGAPGPDSAAAARAALDTLGRLGARDYVADSLVRRGDTLAVWTSPRVWMATDEPHSAVDIVPPARVVAVRHILGG
jgi:hypothetical protein